MKGATMGIIGLAVGSFLGFLLSKGDTPARSERSTGTVERAHQLDRLIVRLSRLLDTEKRLAASSNKEPVHAGEGERGKRPAPEETPLYELARRTVAEEKLRQLGGGPADHEDEVDERLRNRFVFKTYREILSDLGRPNEINISEYGVSFEYRFTDSSGNRREISFEFADGFVYGVSISSPLTIR